MNFIVKKITNSYLLTFLLFFLAIVLRFYNFDSSGFWGDEYNPFWITEPLKTFNEIKIRTNIAPTFIPPYYYYILNLYFHIFEYSVAASKIFHITFGMLCLLITFFFIKIFFKKIFI